MIRTTILIILTFVLDTQISAQKFKLGFKGGFGASFYGINQMEFSEPKGNPFLVEGEGSVVSIQLGVSGFVNIKNSSFYFSPEFYYINGGGKLAFTDLSFNIPDGKKTTISQKDHLFELAALIGVELNLIRVFVGPTFSYRVSTNGAASDYLDNIYNNGLGETNNQSLYLGIVAGFGYSIDDNTVINLRYGFPIFNSEFLIENNTYVNNLAFSLISIDLVYIFE